jgi:hypothetical protein
MNDWAMRIYKEYPLKRGRAAALKAIVKAMKKEAPSRLLRYTKGFAEHERATWEWRRRQGEDNPERFTPYPQRWYNEERWLDEPEAVRDAKPLIEQEL